jgi:hypothetical protein
MPLFGKLLEDEQMKEKPPSPQKLKNFDMRPLIFSESATPA